MIRVRVLDPIPYADRVVLVLEQLNYGNDYVVDDFYVSLEDVTLLISELQDKLEVYS